jgi:site-specific recombinase XerD
MHKRTVPMATDFLPAPAGVYGRGLPPVVAFAGRQTGDRFVEFFTAAVRNANTRRSYHRAAVKFFEWCGAAGLAVDCIRPVHVAAYIEALSRGYSAPTVKQHLAGVRMLFDYLVVGQAIEMNPAAAVRGPSFSAKKGRTPVLDEQEARALLAAIDPTTVTGLRDRAVIGLMIYTFARVGALVAMNVEDYFPQGKRWWVRLHEKGGKRHEVPCHHRLEEFLDAYLDAARRWDNRKGPLFPTAAGRTGQLSDGRMTRVDVYRMVKRRAAAAGIETAIGCHSFRATGITNYLMNGGTLERAQQLANHESARTTKLYDRREDRLSLDEVERISI